MTKAGLGTLVLTATNTYSGGTTISGGELQVGNGTTVGSIAGNITDNGTLTYNHSDTVTIPSTTTISGSGILHQAGAGTLKIFSNLASTFSGSTTVDAGTLQIGDGTGNGTLAGGIALNGTTSVVFNVPGSTTYASPITGTGSLTLLNPNGGSPSTLVLTRASSYTGGSTISTALLCKSAMVARRGRYSAMLAIRAHWFTTALLAVAQIPSFSATRSLVMDPWSKWVPPRY